MRPTVIVVSHTHWDREWYQPFEVFRLRLGQMVEALLALLEREPRFRHFMLDGQTVAVDDVVALHPSLRARIEAQVREGRISVGPWYVLQDELLVGGESIVRNLAEGLRAARRLGRAMEIGYLPDAFGHIAQMPRILRGFGIDTAVVWRGVGDAAPGAEWRWRAPGGAEVLCLWLPGGYGNAHRLAPDSTERLRADLASVLPLSRAGVLLWMNGNDHQPAEAGVPSVIEALAAAFPDVAIEHASLERAAALVRERVDVAALPVVEGELRRATPTVPVLSGTWSARTWQKRDHDRAEALLARVAEPFVAIAGAVAGAVAGIDRRDALAHAWRILLQCQPHDSICGCSIDDVHRDVDARLRQVGQLAGALVAEAAQVLTATPTADFALHKGIALLNPHPFRATATAEVSIQRRVEEGPFRLVGPTGEAAYEIVARAPTDGPDGRPAEWLRLRVTAEELPPLGLRTLAIEPGAPAPPAPLATTLAVHPVAGGIELVDGESGLRVVHTLVDEGDRGDLYDACPREDAPPRSSRDVHLGVHVAARAVGRRVELDVEVDNRAPDHRLRARFELSAPPATFRTDTAFGWIARGASGGTHPASSIALTDGAAPIALGGPGLHELERAADGALLLTLFRATGWMSRGDLATRPGHAGYNVQTPDAQGLGPQRFRHAVAFGRDAAEALRAVEPGLIPAHAVALADARPADREFLSIEPAGVRLSILKRADDGEALIVRLVAPPTGATTARLRFGLPIRRAWLSDLDERPGPPLAIAGDTLTVSIPADDLVTLGVTL